MQSFISISRNFSVKVHGHLKILVHLVNNLIESEDNLELVDTALKMPDFHTEVTRTRYMMKQHETGETRTQAEGGSDMDRFYKVIKNENKKIEEHL